MTIASEITRIKTNIANAYTSASGKGATLPEVQNSDNLPSCIDSISSGGGSSSKYGMTMDNFFGDVDENGVLQAPTIPANIVITGATDIGEGVLNHAFSYNANVESVVFQDVTKLSNKNSFKECFYNGAKIKSISFPKLVEITGQGNFSSVCYNAKNLEQIYFPLLEKIQTGSYGGYTFSNAFYGCKKITSVSFPNLKSTSDEGTFNYAFYNCTELVSADFSSLKSISAGTGGFSSTFYGCTSLTSVDFSSLQSVYADFQSCFRNCTSLTSISFPSLNNLGSNRFGYSSSTYMFNGCTALTEIHFRADMQSTIENYSGYADKWGATNATIYFDL